MEKNYWVVFLILALFLIAETLSVKVGSDPRGSKQFQNKFAVKNRILLKFVIFKPEGNPVIPVFEFVPYLLLLIHTIILLPSYILYWIFDFKFLDMVLKSLVYQLYMSAFLGLIFISSILFRIIDLYKGQKEYKNKNKQ